MKVIKQVVKAVWPTIYGVLEAAADKTTSQVDDIMVEAVNAAIMEWLDD